MKTKEEIEQQIIRLKEIRPKVRPFSAFGDNNLAALDAMIEVLENDMDSDDIWDRWPPEDDLIEIELASADEARNWLDDESEVKDLAEDWPLIEGDEK